MRSLSRTIVVGALSLPLAFAGVGLAAAEDDTSNCDDFSCAYVSDTDTSVEDDSTSSLNFGIAG
ncbi:hypothetical protein [Saccharopolyspora mangrovi]|uniref:Peptidase inhibitor family I36 n=1 Tax=Saccharopolyspora mangrovi TaxID=3082379 RepID=A0ABU6AE14_9PSEU|nr:hypothetical protein [Saccharopolyspora sp. S2-29]MEB3369555.1 hypothetical protein [Saccharopolyspora sp. S2-29]